jgi:AcrR family transcriptional regulator
MTRPRASNYEDKKQLILDQAAALFAGRGFEGTTMNDVAQSCGASKSHLYHYFARKEDLLFAIISEHIQSLASQLTEIVALPSPAEQRFKRFVDVFVQRSAASRNEHLVLMMDLKFLPDGLRSQVRQLETRLVDMVSALLREINPGLMKPGKVRTPYALMLFGTMIWTFTWYHPDGPVSPAELATRLSEVYLDGFRNAKGA